MSKSFDNLDKLARHLFVPRPPGEGLEVGFQRGKKLTYFAGTQRDARLRLASTPYYVVGLDIVAYSRRENHGQFFLTNALYSAISQTVEEFRKAGWFGKLTKSSAGEPKAIISTGDGAFVVFKSLEKAYVFTLSLNIKIQNLNLNVTVVPGEAHWCLPCEVRFSLAMGELIKVANPNNVKDYVGDAIVTCARILAVSKGEHFLIHDRVIDEIHSLGGFREAKHGATGRASKAWDWSTTFYEAHMQDRPVKFGSYSFYNVFGTYKGTETFYDAVYGSRTPVKALRDRKYSIGSHDVSAIL